MKRFLFSLIIFFIAMNVSGQNWYNKSVFENYIISYEVGTSIVLTEYKRDLSGTINEMNHSLANSYSLSIIKLINSNFGIGYEYEYSSFRGYQNNPDFSAYHFGHYKISLMKIEPVIYRSYVKNHNFISTYRFTTNNDNKFIPFIYLKAGMSKLYSVLKYTSNNENIFAKVGWDEDKKNGSDMLVNFNFGLGLGIEWVIVPKLKINLKSDINNINDDNLDAVHNFNAPPPEGYNNYVYGLYSRVMFGVSYTINHNTKKMLSKKKQTKEPIPTKKQRQIFLNPIYRLIKIILNLYYFTPLSCADAR